VSASQLLKQPALSHYCLPPSASSCQPNARLATLAGKVAECHSARSADLHAMASSVHSVARLHPRVFHTISRTEDTVLRPVLDQLMALCCSERCSVVSEDTLRNIYKRLGGFQLASSGSKPEPAIVWESFVLLASEAKGFFGSLFKCLPQGCQSAGDAALLMQRHRCVLGLDHFLRVPPSPYPLPGVQSALPSSFAGCLQ
jgi:hypothetical protein